MTRSEIEALLPFLVNGTLDKADREIVEAALEEDAGLRADFAALTAIRNSMQAEEAGYSPGEMGLARLQRALDKEGSITTSTADAGPPRSSRVWRVAAAILLAIVVGQAAFLLRDGGQQTFQLAGDEAAPIVVSVRPDTTEAALRALLIETGLEIVGGPSALGFYDLAPIDPEMSLDAIRDRLDASGLFDTITLSAGD